MLRQAVENRKMLVSIDSVRWWVLWRRAEGDNARNMLVHLNILSFEEVDVTQQDECTVDCKKSPLSAWSIHNVCMSGWLHGLVCPLDDVRGFHNDLV